MGYTSTLLEHNKVNECSRANLVSDQDVVWTITCYICYDIFSAVICL